ncbi:GtrA family protein [Grimontia kaedaensis]|uniref:GtrA family protein n=1 Tax=Grimontia kaedaensis TaxID=2872157 RepID=A0ABY4WW12_9GAMM|nr:GtrA family protein [Grimontia kaedaensis]USH03507.1 GtrA family protein [Grimontia kaedaensis]
MSKVMLASRYAVFAMVATLVNLATQRLILFFEQSGIALILAIGAGTITGLICKYILDKKWIFFDQAKGIIANSSQFSRYTLTGVITTCVFWGSEAAFWLYWQTDNMREIGAIIGLSVGYVMKYRLDKELVFNAVQPSSKGELTT